MVFIYSDKAVNGIGGGAYVSPRFFDKNKLEKATMVFTNKTEIANAYKEKGIEVRGFPKAKPTETE